MIPAIVITFCFALTAWTIRGVTIAGAVAGFLVTSTLSLARGPAMFAAVLTVFVLTYAATKMGRSRKQSLQIAERSAGRDAAQILANVGVAALMGALSQLTHWKGLFLAGSIAALAEAACDTVSSEAGKALATTARLVTSWERVPAGSDGAISLPGTLLGAIAALVVALEVTATRILNAKFAVIAVLAAIVGTLTDSLLGATLEHRGWLTNNAVNLVSTAASALLAILATWQFS